MFDNKLKKELKELKDYSFLTRTVLDGHVKLTLEFVDVIKEKLEKATKKIASVERRMNYMKKELKSGKRAKKLPKKVYGFVTPKEEVKNVRKNKKTRKTSK